MLTLSDEEIRVLTGYKQQCKQLEELHAQGFSRARIVRGRLILLGHSADAAKSIAEDIVRRRRSSMTMESSSQPNDLLTEIVGTALAAEVMSSIFDSSPSTQTDFSSGGGGDFGVGGASGSW